MLTWLSSTDSAACSVEVPLEPLLYHASSPNGIRSDVCTSLGMPIFLQAAAVIPSIVTRSISQCTLHTPAIFAMEGERGPKVLLFPCVTSF